MTFLAHGKVSTLENKKVQILINQSFESDTSKIKLFFPQKNYKKKYIFIYAY